RRPGATRIYLSGPRTARILELPLAGVMLIPVGEEIGTASAVKMCTASVYKGSVALLTQALLTARAHGVEEHVLADLREGASELADDAARSIARAATKASRYVGEMHEIAATQAAAGLTPDLFAAMVTVYAALADSSAARRAPEEAGEE